MARSNKDDEVEVGVAETPFEERDSTQADEQPTQNPNGGLDVNTGDGDGDRHPIHGNNGVDRDATTVGMPDGDEAPLDSSNTGTK